MRDSIEMALANRVKTVRAAIRLRHSIAADNELNEVLAQVKTDFYKAMQDGEVPDALDIKKLLG